MRYHEPGAEIMPVSVEKNEAGQFVHGACIVWDDRRHGTLWLVNDHPVEYIRAKLRLPQLAQSSTQWKWWCKDPFMQHELMDVMEGKGELTLTLRPWSVNAISTREGPGGPGGPDRSPKVGSRHESVPAIDITED